MADTLDWFITKLVLKFERRYGRKPHNIIFAFCGFALHWRTLLGIDDIWDIDDIITGSCHGQCKPGQRVSRRWPTLFGRRASQRLPLYLSGTWQAGY